MIIDELVLHNFGVYRGRQEIALAPPSRKQPVVLFGGLNGGGKTTLLDGLQLALYGKNARCSNRGSLSYTDYLDHCINSQVAKADGAGLEIQFRHHSEGEEHEIRLHRSWYATGSGAIRERLEVYRNGDEDRALTEAWAERVDEFMPSGISHLFLFDGEKIEGFAEVESSSKLLSTAIGSLLGLDLVDQLSTDLVVLGRRQRASMQSDEERKKIAAAETEVESLDERLAALSAESGAAQNEVDKAEAALRKIEKRFKKEGGEAYEQRAQLESERESATARVVELENELRDLVAGILPLAIIPHTLLALVEQDYSEVEAEKSRALRDTLELRDTALTELLYKQGVAMGIADTVAKYLAEDRAQRARAAQVEAFLALSSDARDSLRAVPAVTRQDGARAKQLVETLERQRGEVDRVDRRLASVPTPEAISALQQDRTCARARVETARARKAALHAEIEQANRTQVHQKAKLVRMIEKQVKDEFSNEDSLRIAHHAQRVRTTLGSFRERLVERHVKRIEWLILESLQHLLRKKSLVSALSIDPRTFNVELRDRTGAPLAANRLSAGERQLLAVSMLWGLARASGRPLPAVIDTPLGRLDSSHRAHLVQRYFPYASHQVLLLSTDEEIDERYLAQLRPHVGRSYLLDHDDNQGTTSVREGYFWEAS